MLRPVRTLNPRPASSAVATTASSRLVSAPGSSAYDADDEKKERVRAAEKAKKERGKSILYIWETCVLGWESGIPAHDDTLFEKSLSDRSGVGIETLPAENQWLYTNRVNGVRYVMLIFAVSSSQKIPLPFGIVTSPAPPRLPATPPSTTVKDPTISEETAVEDPAPSPPLICKFPELECICSHGHGFSPHGQLREVRVVEPVSGLAALAVVPFEIGRLRCGGVGVGVGLGVRIVVIGVSPHGNVGESDAVGEDWNGVVACEEAMGREVGVRGRVGVEGVVVVFMYVWTEIVEGWHIPGDLDPDSISQQMTGYQPQDPSLVELGLATTIRIFPSPCPS
ncbi:hypothetical protein E6O75_ATG00520 [Venturia nashicola]|uniref:Uncharacterized protein n=1 Tax=Venturia nashicola TaxID=86259 RepID=A0A4Z1PFL2_9PEZI|nr:hypothetical protein E6O75_ATG00520 [Venturia nashicola]